ncbi:MAG: LamG-like jellyroll fold domain-containing protein [Kofleriaceae bacterium]
MSTWFGLAIALGALGACGFQPTAQAVQPDAQRLTGTLDGNTAVAQDCHVDDTSLRLCLDFEDPSLDPTVADRSTFHHDGAAQLVSAVSRTTTQQAALFTATSRLHVAETADLDIPDHVTVELWSEVFDPTERPWLFDNAKQYALAIDHDHLFCYAKGAYANTTINLGVSTWHHLACTYGDGKLIAFVDGKQAACQKVTGPIDANANTGGTDLGTGLIGAIDDVHVYARSLSSAEIATLAGTTPGLDVPCGNGMGG